MFNVLLSNLAPVLIMPIFNKYVPLGDEHKELADRLLRLAERAHTKVRGVYKFDMSRRTKSANAALTGIGNTRRIVLGDTLINEFSTDEIERMHRPPGAPRRLRASTVQDLTGLPFICTVHAPHDVVSQPICVPVMLKFSRRKWTSSNRDSTSAS